MPKKLGRDLPPLPIPKLTQYIQVLKSGQNPKEQLLFFGRPSLRCFKPHFFLSLKVRDALANGGNANSLDGDGTSALQFAVKYGHAEVVQVLLDSPELALNSRFQFPYNGTPLQLAAR